LAREVTSRLSHRRPRRDEPEQRILPPAPPATPKAKARVIPALEQAARAYIARRHPLFVRWLA